MDLSIKVRVETRNAITSSFLELVAKLIVELGTHATAPGREHLVTQGNIGPVVPADERAGVELTKGVLGSGEIIVVGKSEAVGANTILVVDQVGSLARQRELVAGTAVATMAGWCNADNSFTLGEDDNVLPVVAVSAQEASHDSLVLLEVVLIHDGTNAVVAAGARVSVAVLQLRRVTALALRSAGGSLAGVCVAAGVDSSRVVAAVAVKVEEWLELVLDIAGTAGQSADDVTLDQGWCSLNGGQSTEDNCGLEEGVHGE